MTRCDRISVFRHLVDKREQTTHFPFLYMSILQLLKKEFAENPIKSKQDNHTTYNYYYTIVF